MLPSLLAASIGFAAPPPSELACCAGLLCDRDYGHFRVRQSRVLPDGVRGEVTVLLRTDVTGALVSAELQEPTGDAALDREILDSVRAAAPFKPHCPERLDEGVVGLDRFSFAILSFPGGSEPEAVADTLDGLHRKLGKCLEKVRKKGWPQCPHHGLVRWEARAGEPTLVLADFRVGRNLEAPRCAAVASKVRLPAELGDDLTWYFDVTPVGQ